MLRISQVKLIADDCLDHVPPTRMAKDGIIC